MAKKKSSRRAKTPQISLQGTIPKLQLTMPLDARKIAAIRRCLEKGTLTITMSRVDFSRGRVGDPWLYD
jgi:hypothetical protein